MQISTLIFAPAFLAAGWYIMLGKLIAVLGPQYCRFNRKTYAVAFVLGDVASIVIQAVGGGIASVCRFASNLSRIELMAFFLAALARSRVH